MAKPLIVLVWADFDSPEAIDHPGRRLTQIFSRRRPSGS